MPLPNHCNSCDKPILNSRDGLFICKDCEEGDPWRMAINKAKTIKEREEDNA
tara:strand:- start:615 stop:770 length:156 start_codon:yes stop_codon:yes gene_type:complete